jgi:hypothetical protein
VSFMNPEVKFSVPYTVDIFPTSRKSCV